jgi:hypothetical protein
MASNGASIWHHNFLIILSNMDSFLRSQRSTRASQASQGPPPSVGHSNPHFSSSRRLEKSRAVESSPSIESSQSSPQSSSISLESPLTSPTPEAPAPELLKSYPDYPALNGSTNFQIDWDNIWVNNQRVRRGRIGYRVRHRSQLRGNRELSSVWKFGADLQYREPSGRDIRIWLCKACHSAGAVKSSRAAKVVSGYAHIVRHLLKDHRIIISRGEGSELLPDEAVAQNPWQAAAAAARLTSGGGNNPSHFAWREKELQEAYIN